MPLGFTEHTKKFSPVGFVTAIQNLPLPSNPEIAGKINKLRSLLAEIANIANTSNQKRSPYKEINLWNRTMGLTAEILPQLYQNGSPEAQWADAQYEKLSKADQEQVDWTNAIAALHQYSMGRLFEITSAVVQYLKLDMLGSEIKEKFEDLQRLLKAYQSEANRYETLFNSLKGDQQHNGFLAEWIQTQLNYHLYFQVKLYEILAYFIYTPEKDKNKYLAKNLLSAVRHQQVALTQMRNDLTPKRPADGLYSFTVDKAGKLAIFKPGLGSADKPYSVKILTSPPQHIENNTYYLILNKNCLPKLYASFNGEYKEVADVCEWGAKAPGTVEGQLSTSITSFNMMVVSIQDKLNGLLADMQLDVNDVVNNEATSLKVIQGLPQPNDWCRTFLQLQLILHKDLHRFHSMKVSGTAVPVDNVGSVVTERNGEATGNLLIQAGKIVYVESNDVNQAVKALEKQSVLADDYFVHEVTVDDGSKVAQQKRPVPQQAQRTEQTYQELSLIHAINQYIAKRALETGTRWLGFSAADYHKRQQSWERILKQLDTLDSFNPQTYTAVLETVAKEITQFDKKSRYRHSLSQLHALITQMQQNNKVFDSHIIKEHQQCYESQRHFVDAYTHTSKPDATRIGTSENLHFTNYYRLRESSQHLKSFLKTPQLLAAVKANGHPTPTFSYFNPLTWWRTRQPSKCAPQTPSVSPKPRPSVR